MATGQPSETYPQATANRMPVCASFNESCACEGERWMSRGATLSAPSRDGFRQYLQNPKYRIVPTKYVEDPFIDDERLKRPSGLCNVPTAPQHCRRCQVDFRNLAQRSEGRFTSGLGRSSFHD